MIPPPPDGMRFELRRGFVDGGELGDPDLMPHDHVTAEARRRAAAAGVITLALFVLMMLGLTAYVMGQQWTPPAGPTVTPSTYGWPGPNGGPTR